MQLSVTEPCVEYHLIEESLRSLLRIEEAETRNASLRERLLGLQKKLASGRLHIAVLGQMKRGKSSFINALIGAEVLPTGVLPVTAIITKINYGTVPDATVAYSVGGLREAINLGTLADYITEAGNPGNKKQIESVEISYPSPFLKSGIVLVDTPGIGSTHAHNTQTTVNYLDHIDAAIVVLSVDPPLTEVEYRFLKDLTKQVPKLFFILNKTDLASPEEISHISHFLKEELSRLQIERPEVFPLSSREALYEKRVAGVSGANGISVFEKRLRTFLLEEMRHVLVRAVAWDVLQIARTLKFAASVGVRAREMSAEALKNKRIELELLVEQTETELRELEVLLRQRGSDIIADAGRSLDAQVKACIPEIQRRLKLFSEHQIGKTGRAFGTAVETFFHTELERVFDRWRMQKDEEINTQLAAVSARFVGRANDITERLEQAAGLLFESPVEHLSITWRLRAASQLRYEVERVFYSLDSFLLVLPGFLLRPIVSRRIRSKVPRLLDINAGRIRYDYVERLQSSMAQFEKDIRAAVKTLTESLRFVLFTSDDTSQLSSRNILDAVINHCSQLLL